jgi:hypothetical protein
MLKNKTAEREIHILYGNPLWMRFPILLGIILSMLLFSCVSKDKYDELAQENETLRNELIDIKFGAPAMLSDAKKFFTSK